MRSRANIIVAASGQVGYQRSAGRLKPWHRSLNPLYPKRMAQFMTSTTGDSRGHEYVVRIGIPKPN